VALAVLNNYGGEVVLRVSLFSLPFLALLGGFALVREGGDQRAARRAGVAVLAASAVLLPLFVAARFGNEAFERIETDDIAAWDYLAGHAPAGATVVVPDFAGPWRYSALMRFEYKVFDDEVGGEPTARRLDRLVAKGGKGHRPGYLILGTASAHYREIAQGYPPDWADRLTRQLMATGHYRIVFRAGATRVLEREERG
jgi:hypothetical protein